MECAPLAALHPTELAIGEHVVRADEQRHPEQSNAAVGEAVGDVCGNQCQPLMVMSTATSTLTSVSHRSSGHLPGSLEVPSIGEGGVARCGGRRVSSSVAGDYRGGW
jgi:xanthine dehydrogenase iron-sulfur cluster and FAD-binding subunit A